MAEKEIVFKTRVGTGKSKQDVDNLNKSLKQTQKEANTIGTTSAQKLEQLNKKMNDGSMNARDMRRALVDYQTIAMEAGRTSPVGKQAIKDAANLRDKLVDLDNEIKRASQDGKNLQGALQLGGSVVAGYGVAQGAMALMGEESEELQKTFVKLQAATAAMNGIEQIRASLEKESAMMLVFRNAQTKIATAVTAAYATVVGTTTGALKVFRIALASTGIGAIIVGIGLLIANFEDVWNWIKKVGNMIYDFFKPSIDAVIDALQFLGIVESDAAKEARKRADEEKQMRKDLAIAAQKEADEKIDALDRVQKKRERNHNYELELMKIQGATQEEIFEAEMENSQKILNEQRERLAAINRKEEALKAEIKTLELGNEEHQERSDKIVEEIEALRESRGALLDNNKALVDEAKLRKAAFEASQEKEKTDALKKAIKERKAARDKAREERERKEEEERKLSLEREKLFQDLVIENIEDANLRQLMELEVAHNREREQLKEKYGEDTALLKELEARQANELAAVKKEIQDKADEEQTQEELAAAETARKRRKASLELELIEMRENFEAQQEVKKELAQLEMERELAQENLLEEEKLLIKKRYAEQIDAINKETADKEVDRQQEVANATKDIMSTSANAIQGLSDAVFAYKLEKAEKGSAKELSIQKKQFEINKKLQIAQAIMQGIQATQAAYSSGSAIPIVGAVTGPLFAALAAATSAFNVAKISKTTFQGGGGGGASTGVSAPDLGGITEEAEQRTITDTASLTGGDNDNEGESKTKVEIVDSEIKASMKDTEKVDVISNIG